jgi:hypothetical protein
LLLLAAAFIVWFQIVEHGLEAWTTRSSTDVRRRVPLLVSGFAALVMLLGAAVGLLMPRWIDKDLASTLGGSASVERQLAATRPGYALYRYIAQHNIAKVLHPLSDTGEFEVSAYAQGHDNEWILPPTLLPANPASTGQFLRANGVHYFIEPDRYVPPKISGAVHDPDRGRAVIAQLKPGARLVLRDPSGFSLYALALMVPP